MMCEKLDATGAAVFRDDRDIDGGDNIPKKIRAAIKKSEEVVVLLTPASVGRQWVNIEIGAAWVFGDLKRITVVLYGVSVDDPTFPQILKDVKAVPLNDFDQFVIEVTGRRKAFRAKVSKKTPKKTKKKRATHV